MDVTFTLCSELDLSEVINLSKNTFSNAFEKDNNPQDFKKYISEAFSEDSVRQQLRNTNSSYYFVHSTAGVIAYFKTNEFDAQSELQENEGFELERIYVLAEHQGKGIGIQILKKVMALAKEKGKHYLWLGVWERNKRAIKWYQEQGFIKFGTHSFFIGEDEQTDWLMKKMV